METPAAGAGAGAPPPPPPSEPPKVPSAKRFKFVWPILLTVNLGLGAYMLLTKKKDKVVDDDKPVVDVPSTPTKSTTTVTGISSHPGPNIEQPKVERPPIPEDQQRELFKWILEEKRKIKPKDKEEKKRIDEEKAILKQFIRSKSIRSL